MLDLLRGAVWGSRDTKYQILNIEAKLQRLRDPLYFVLSEHGEELCVFVLDHCRKPVGRSECDAYHFAMAATVRHRRNQGLAGILIDQIRPYCEARLGKPGLGFAYVESTTEFSLRLSDRVGHSIEADIALLLFTRFFPHEDARVGRIGREEIDGFRAALKDLYADHELVDVDASVNPDECFVYRRAGNVAAGVQAEVLRWSVESMPGFAGKLLLEGLPLVPGLKRVIDLRDLRILRFGNLLVPEGSEAEFFTVLSACLARHEARIGLIMLDERSPVLARLRRHGRFGLLSRGLNGSVKLCLDTVGMEPDLAARLANHPLHVSAADVF
ncbi:hypothetical protein AVO45_04195 [Ruegeria marisrubri]|uniref:N-acetyltransferase domain-containing protein n=2 Tax=Ruegeria marisrubri TaxID=1685379 RepID=A0A101CZD0_9RHOB|nr:hypothetical protein AVO45_04195 [Ruegeria marisrubri]